MIDHRHAFALIALTAIAGCGKAPDAGAASPATTATADAEATAAADAAAGDRAAVDDAAATATADTPSKVTPADGLRASFKTCIDAAGAVDPVMQACIGEEYEYQDGRLNAAYGVLRRTLPEARMARLRTEQRGWIAGRDRDCAWDAKTEGSAQRLQANYCRMQATATRAGELEAMARGDAGASSASTASPAAGAGIALNATPDDDGRLSLSAGDLRFALDAPDCRRSGTMLLVCDEATLVVTRAGAPAQTLRPAVLYVNPSATLYRGPSDGRDRSKSQTLVVADVDGDGADDLALWTGLRGGYGGASYDIHLWNPARRAFVRSDAFSALTVGRSGLFTATGKTLRTSAKSGCCLQTEEAWEIRGGVPTLVERIVEDAGEGAPARRTVSRLIDGRMREVTP